MSKIDLYEQADMNSTDETIDEQNEREAAEIEFEKQADGKSETLSHDTWKRIVRDYNSDNSYLHDRAGEDAFVAMKPFIIFLAKKFYGSYYPKYKDDLISEGSLGLIENLRSYNPDKAKPTTWFSRQILHHMRDFIDREVHHTTTHYQDSMRKIREFINEMESRGKSWTYDDIRVNTGVSLTTIINCLTIEKRNKDSVSMDQETNDGTTVLREVLYSATPNPEDQMIRKETMEELCRDMMACLNQDELDVIALRFGLYDDVQKSAPEIAAITGIPKQDIRPIQNAAEYKLRCYTNKKPHYANEKRARSIYGKTHPVELFRSEESLGHELDTLMFEEDDELIAFINS